ncbi:hypothetical protein GCM10027570_00300 [Streptomonospora sediminis]
MEPALSKGDGPDCAQEGDRTGTPGAPGGIEPAPEGIAARLAVEAGAEVMRTSYIFTGDDEPVLLSASYEPMEITRGTAVVLPEDGPHAGRGVVERMRQIGQLIVHAGEVVTARTAAEEEADRLRLGRGVVERMRQIGQLIVHAGEVVTARTAAEEEADRLRLGRGAFVMVIQRAYYTEDRPVETADIVVPPDRYELAYTIPVEQG